MKMFLRVNSLPSEIENSPNNLSLTRGCCKLSFSEKQRDVLHTRGMNSFVSCPKHKPCKIYFWQLIFLVAIICGSHSRRYVNCHHLCTHGDIFVFSVVLLFVYIYIVYSGSQAIQRFNFISTNINCQLVLAVGSQAIQRFNFISTNFQPSTDNVNCTFMHRLSSTHWSSWGFDEHLLGMKHCPFGFVVEGVFRCSWFNIVVKLKPS
jgi:hypothetical protein